ncbi:MAG: plasmid mobilization protein [Candidatus Micrarchaeaceae archaeon]
MASSSESKPQELIPPASSAASSQEMYRTKSIATRLTDAEFAEVEVAAAKAGKKVSEWLRDVALGHVRAAPKVTTDSILLAEIMGMRSLMLNLFAKASEGPISSEDLRKMSLYADSIKEQKALEYLAQRRLQDSTK